MKRLYIFLILIIISALFFGCSSSEKAPSENTTLTQGENQNSVYLQNNAYIESCYPQSIYTDNNTVTSLMYDENAQKIILARINSDTAVYIDDDFSVTCKTEQTDGATAVIDFGKNKTVRLYDNNNLTKTGEYDLSPYYENSVLKTYTGSDIIISQNAEAAFFVDTNEKQYLYYLQSPDSESQVIYEFNRLNYSDNEISYITRLLCLTDDKLYFEGAISENGISSNKAALGYIKINNGEITELTRETAVSFYACGKTIYSQDYQLNSSDTGSGSILIYDTETNTSHTVKTEKPAESLNCKASANGKFLCTLQNEANNSIITIYNAKSSKVIKSAETTPDYIADMLCIDGESRTIYMPNSNTNFKNISKLSF